MFLLKLRQACSAACSDSLLHHSLAALHDTSRRPTTRIDLTRSKTTAERPNLISRRRADELCAAVSVMLTPGSIGPVGSAELSRGRQGWSQGGAPWDVLTPTLACHVVGTGARGYPPSLGVTHHLRVQPWNHPQASVVAAVVSLRRGVGPVSPLSWLHIPSGPVRLIYVAAGHRRSCMLGWERQFGRLRALRRQRPHPMVRSGRSGPLLTVVGRR